jgi:putative transposon-encoded protein
MEKQGRKLYFRAAVTLLVMLLTTMTAWADNPDWLRSGDSWDDATKTLTVNSTSVADNAYSRCSEIVNVVFSDNVTDIGSDAFAYCTGLTTVTFGPNSHLEYIGSSAFYECNNTGFISIEIPAGVTTIGNSAFTICSSLATITFAEGSQLENVGRMAFYMCSALSAVTFPASVKAIGEDAFTRCDNLTDITVDAGNAYYASEDGVLFDKAKTTLIQYPQAKSGTAYTIPASVKTVAGYAFYGCSTLASVIIPDGVQTIGEHAFDGCSALTSVIIPDGVTEIGDYTFDNCSNLTSVIIPDGVQTIGEAAFAGCSALTSVTIPASVTSIGVMAFSGCFSLKTVYSLPIQAPELGMAVFDFFPQGFVAYVPSNSNGYNNQNWGGLRFYLDRFDGSCGTNVYYLYRNGTLTIVGTGAMADYETPEDQPWKAYREDITSVVIEKVVTGIGNYAFVGCSNLTDITVDAVNAYYVSEDGVLFDKQKTTLIQYPQAKSGTAYTIPASVKSIGAGAFCYCTSLSSIILNSNPFIASDAFYLTPATVTMNLTGNEGETGEYWTTFYNENYNFQVPAEGTQVFKAALSGSTLALTELTTDKIVTKNNAVILKSTTGPIALTLTSTDSGNDFTGNSLLGVNDPDGLTADDPSTAYVLNKKNDVVGFYKLKAGKKAGVGKAYLTYSDALTKEFFGFEDDADGISEELRVKSEKSATAVYDLSGRRVDSKFKNQNSKFDDSSLFTLHSSLKKGLYIVNGKKVFIK